MIRNWMKHPVSQLQIHRTKVLQKEKNISWWSVLKETTHYWSVYLEVRNKYLAVGGQAAGSLREVINSWHRSHNRLHLHILWIRIPCCGVLGKPISLDLHLVEELKKKPTLRPDEILKTRSTEIRRIAWNQLQDWFRTKRSRADMAAFSSSSTSSEKIERMAWRSWSAVHWRGYFRKTAHEMSSSILRGGAMWICIQVNSKFKYLVLKIYAHILTWKTLLLFPWKWARERQRHMGRKLWTRETRKDKPWRSRGPKLMPSIHRPWGKGRGEAASAKSRSLDPWNERDGSEGRPESWSPGSIPNRTVR